MNNTVKLNDLFHQLPHSWDTLKYKHYRQIINIEMQDETRVELDDLLRIDDMKEFTVNLKANVENTAAILSVILDIPAESILNLQQQHFLLLANRISFIYTEPNIKGYKSNIEWKDFNSITTNDYILFFTLAADPVNNLGRIIQSFTVNQYTDEQIDEMSALEINYGFFLLMQKYQKYTQQQIRKQAKKIMKTSAMSLVTRMKQKFFMRRKKSGKGMGGSSL